MTTTIHWFRRDLRLTDNPALLEATKAGQTLPLYILDPKELDQAGGAIKLWLFYSLTSLNKALGGKLHIAAGPTESVLAKLIQTTNATSVSWTRRYDPAGIATDKSLMENLKTQGIDVISRNGSLLWEPWEVNKPDGTPYRVFTPFFKRGCLAAAPPRVPLPAPEFTALTAPGSDLAALQNLRPKPDWGSDLIAHWSPGEAGAQAALTAFTESALQGYKANRDIPAKPGTSRLSPHLHFGEISPHQIWHALRDQPNDQDTYHFRSELGWREFSHHLLFRHPTLNADNLNPKFDAFPWREDPDALHRWQQGQTGIPIVDAGMRELWQTGYMHNRVRMIVASFLIKNLMIHWRHGLAWFHDTLVDADPANNAASWQWVAGSGADAAPYFRIFNPVTQARKFDPDGHYIRQYVPEIAHLDNKLLHAPWEAPPPVLANLKGRYPAPLVDLKESRERALAAFSSLS